MATLDEQTARWVEANSLGSANDQFLAELGQACYDEALRRGMSTITVDVHFLVFLRRFSRFGFFQFGPIAIDVAVIEDLVDHTAMASPGEFVTLGDDVVRFSRLLMGEVRNSGRKRVDELTYLLTFMRWGEGIPARVFGELGVTPEQVQRFARGRANSEGGAPEKLYSPEEAAEYLGVHIQTVRAWIRAGRLKASRLAGQRALRIRASDLQSVLEPVEPGDL